ncbi:hypothetical protein ACHAWU_006812 [Discostella pseudostelligera]|uniref:3'(2'),5'-bisphosphate nucleotidase n=1 Tax=Discostella pseudostelligera TaxID=259834 RepID=A0ABD3N3C6_9STRA
MSFDDDASLDTIDLAVLLSTCIDACRRGCEVIRNVRHKSLHGTSDILDSVLYKIADDPRSALTEADGASQKVIIECLTSCWEKHIKAGRIRIVGEEEDEHSTDLECDNSFDTAYSEDIMSHFDNYNCPRPDLEPIQRDMFESVSSPGCSKEPPESTEIGDSNISKQGESVTQHDEIIIFIDPMDGTREFVEGRIQNVQCLIGITVNGLPVAGAMGMPMVHDHQIEIAYGLITPQKTNNMEESESVTTTTVPVLSGVKFFESINPLDILPKPTKEDQDVAESGNGADDDGTLMVYSGDSMKPALNLAMDCLENRILRGTGEEDEVNIIPGAEEGVNSMHPPIRKIVAGGCGHKILSLQRHVQSLSSRHKSDEQEYTTVGAISIGPPGSSSWDTAAPTAVLLAVDPNARVTDLFGQPLIYDGDNLSNKLGIVVSSGYVASRIHEALCMKLSRDEALHEVLGVSMSSKTQSNALELDNL